MTDDGQAAREDAVNALLDILDVEADWVSPHIQLMTADEKLALVFKIAKRGLGHPQRRES